MGKKAEKRYPCIIAIVITLAIVISGYKVNDVQKFEKMLSSTINMSSILIGFLATMISILIANTKSIIIKKIKKLEIVE